jgi:hypothetical protein
LDEEGVPVGPVERHLSAFYQYAAHRALRCLTRFAQ